MDMKRHIQEGTPIAEQAARWLQQLERSDAREQAAFAAWLKESPRHIEELLCAKAVNTALEHLDRRYWPDVSSFLSDPSGLVVPLQIETTDRPRVPRVKRGSRVRVWGVAAAIVATATVAGWWTIMALAGWDRYSTVVGEQRALTLEDGSLAYLNTHSQVDVRFTEAQREVRLVAGEALFKVEHDSARPFRVHSGDAVIEAVGTQFNVRRVGGETTVVVVEGAVRVSGAGQKSELLRAGEATQVDRNTLVEPAKVELARASAWRERRLVFELDTLAEVADEFNRYNRSPHLRVVGEVARNKRFSGVFDADEPTALTGLLATYEDLMVEQRGEEVVIRGR